jgi:hypothetical protein
MKPLLDRPEPGSRALRLHYTACRCPWVPWRLKCPPPSPHRHQPVLRQRDAVGGVAEQGRRQHNLPAGAAGQWPGAQEDMARAVGWLRADRIARRRPDAHLRDGPFGGRRRCGAVPRASAPEGRAGGVAGAIILSGLYDVSTAEANPPWSRTSAATALATPNSRRCRALCAAPCLCCSPMPSSTRPMTSSGRPSRRALRCARPADARCSPSSWATATCRRCIRCTPATVL